MTRRVSLICFIVLLGLLLSGVGTAYAYSGSDYTSNTELATKLDNLIQGNVALFSNDTTKFKVGMRLDNSKLYYWKSGYYSGKQCYAYGQAAYYYLFGECPVHGDSSYSKSKVIPGVKGLNALSYDVLANAGVGCGAYIRTTVNANGSYSGSYGHSMIVLAYDSSSITIIHGNSDSNGMISINTYTWSKFNSTHISGRNRYVSHIVQPNLTANTNESTPAGADTGTIQYYERAIYKGNGASGNNVKKYPYSGSDVETLEENYGAKQFTVTHAVKNKYNNIWYAVEGGGYIYSGDVTYVRSCPTFRIENENTPSGNLGNIDAFYNKGTIISSDSILKATSAIYTSGNVLVQGPYTATNSSLTQQSLSMNKTDMAYGLAFGKLPAGSYTYVVKVWYGNHGLSEEVIRSNFTIGTATTTPTYTLDVAARMNGVEQSNLAGLGTFDMYINGTLVANDVTDYNAQHPSGTQYQITDITTNSVTSYTGVYSGTLSGTTGSADRKIVLSFEDIPTASIPSAYSVNLGYRVQLPGGEATDANTGWYSSDTSILKTDDYGYICGIMPGTAVVTAVSSSGETLGSCEVTIIPNTTTSYDYQNGEQTAMMVDGDQRMDIVRFIPEYSGYYVFQGCVDDSDTYGYLYDENWDCINLDDDSGENAHFWIRHFLKAGETYYLAARLYNVFSDGGLSYGLSNDDPIYGLLLDNCNYVNTTNNGEYVYYSFTAPENGTYIFSSIGDYDTVGELYHWPDTSDNEWVLIAYDDDGGDICNFRLQNELAAGETYVVAAHFYNESTLGEMAVMVERYIEEGYLNASMQANINLGGAYVYYRFTPAQTGFYHFTSYGNSDTYGYVYDGDTWEQLASDDDSSEGNNFDVVCYMLAGKSYILGARFFSQSSTGSFDVKVAKHILMQMELDQQYGISVDGDGAYYNLSFTPSESGSYVFSSSGGSDTVGWLYDSEMNSLLNHDDDGGADFNFRIVYDLTAGTTYVLSSGLYSDGIIGTYSVQVEKYVDLEALWASADFVLPSALRSIQAESFIGIRASYVKLPEGVTSVGARAFANCYGLQGIYVPAGCTSIAPDAFAGVDLNGFAIYGYRDSYAEDYASASGIKFVAMDD